MLIIIRQITVIMKDYENTFANCETLEETCFWRGVIFGMKLCLKILMNDYLRNKTENEREVIK